MFQWRTPQLIAGRAHLTASIVRLSSRYRIPSPKERIKRRRTELVLPSFRDDREKDDDFSLLHAASFNGWTEVVERLLDGPEPDCNPNQVTKGGGFTPLFGAVTNKSAAVVKLLLSRGADVLRRDIAGRSPIHSAADAGRVDIVQLLLDANPECAKATTDQGRTPLHYSAAWDRAEASEMFIKAGADIQAKTNDGRQPLHMAAQNNAIGVVRLLLAHRAEVNFASHAGWMPIHVAVEHEATETAVLLAEHGAELFTPNGGGWTALHIASARANVPVIEACLSSPECKEKLSVRTTKGWTALMVAAQKGDVKIASMLLAAGLGTEYQTVDGWTAMHIAIDENHDEVVQLLLDAGAPVNKCTSHGMTCLNLAVRRGRLSAVQLLLTHDASTINVANRSGWPPLLVGAQQGFGDIVWYLIQAGADTAAASPCGRQALHLAAESGHAVALECLIPHGDINCRNCVGQTPLHRAASAGALEAVMLLIQHGADINVQSKARYTAVDYALQGGHENIAAYLGNCGGTRGRVARAKKGRANNKKLEGGRRDQGGILVDGFNKMAREHDIHFEIHNKVRPNIALTVRWEFSSWLHVTMGQTEGVLNDSELQLRAYRAATNLASSTHRKQTEDQLPVPTPHQLRLGTEALQKAWMGEGGFHEYQDRINALDGRLLFRLSMQPDAAGAHARYRGEIGWKCFWTGVEEIESVPIHAIVVMRNCQLETEFTAPVLPTLIRQMNKATHRLLSRMEHLQADSRKAEEELTESLKEELSL